MRIEFDPTKNVLNIRIRGLSFEAVADFDFATARVARDERRQYPEVRYVAIGWIGERLHVLCASRRSPVASGSSASARPTDARSESMSKRPPLTDAEGEVRELTEADLHEFRPAHEVLPSATLKALGVRGPQKAPTKERITIRLSRDVLEAFRATGDGWQTRVDAALKDFLARRARGGRTTG